MSKPSQELLRRAREFCEGKDVEQDTRTSVVVSPLLAQFAEQIVRECADEAMLGHTGYECNQRILSKFGLKE